MMANGAAMDGNGDDDSDNIKILKSLPCHRTNMIIILIGGEQSRAAGRGVDRPRQRRPETSEKTAYGEGGRAR